MSNRRPYPTETGVGVLFAGLIILLGLGMVWYASGGF